MLNYIFLLFGLIRSNFGNKLLLLIKKKKEEIEEDEKTEVFSRCRHN